MEIEREVFSFSRLTKYETCPAAFYQVYYLGAETALSEPLVFGKSAHAVIETAMKLQNTSEEFFAAVCEAMAGVAPVPIDPKELFELTCQKIVLNKFSPQNNIESHFVVPLDPDDPFSPSIQGYIDLWADMGDYVQLVDWKTNRKTYNPVDTYQLGLYAWHLHNLTGKPVRGRLVFLRTREEPEYEYSGEDMEEAREWALNLATEIQEKRLQVLEGANYLELFPPKPGNCKYCERAMDCIDGNIPAVPGEIRTYPEAVELAGEIVRMEEVLEQMKSLLKKYVEVAGPVSTGSREFAFHRSRWWKWDPKSLMAACQKIIDQGKSPFEYLSLTGTNAKKLGWDDEVLKALGAKPQVRMEFKSTAAEKPPAQKALARTA